MPRAGPPADPPGALPIVVLASGGSLGVLGAVLALFGGGAFVGPTWTPFGGALGPGVIGVVAGIGGLRGGQELKGRISAMVPRLYPYARARTQIGLWLLGVVSAAAVVSALFSEYSGALGGGDSASVANPDRLNDLYLAASGLLWVFALWVILLIARVVGIGRALERARGRNVYGQVEEEADGAARPNAGVPSGPPASDQRSAVLGSTIAVALVAMAGIQAIEVGADPPPLALWAGLELATPVWAFAVAWAVLGIDGYVRDLERRYVALPGPAAPTSPPPSGIEGSSGFVP
ncbi:MAG: hypothetical protein L3K08_03885 [Thermoplasmata archaeon]|nr:hypothetical protein [Thermoplasmata archaeon]